MLVCLYGHSTVKSLYKVLKSQFLNLLCHRLLRGPHFGYTVLHSGCRLERCLPV